MSNSPFRPSTSSLSHPSTSASASTINRNRQYTHLHAQLAQLNAHLADLENLVGMTAVQADFMAASKILGEEAANAAGAGAQKGDKEEGKQK